MLRLLYTVKPEDSRTAIYVEERGKPETRKLHKAITAVLTSSDARVFQDQLNALADRRCKGCGKKEVK